MTVNLGIVSFLIVVGLSAFLWMYRRGKVAVLLDMARAELKKIKRIQKSSDAIDAETKKKQDRVAGNNVSRLRNFWLRGD